MTSFPSQSSTLIRRGERSIQPTRTLMLDDNSISLIRDLFNDNRELMNSSRTTEEKFITVCEIVRRCFDIIELCRSESQNDISRARETLGAEVERMKDAHQREIARHIAENRKLTDMLRTPLTASGNVNPNASNNNDRKLTEENATLRNDISALQEMIENIKQDKVDEVNVLQMSFQQERERHLKNYDDIKAKCTEMSDRIDYYERTQSNTEAHSYNNTSRERQVQLESDVAHYKECAQQMHNHFQEFKINANARIETHVKRIDELKEIINKQNVEREDEKVSFNEAYDKRGEELRAKEAEITRLNGQLERVRSDQIRAQATIEAEEKREKERRERSRASRAQSPRQPAIGTEYSQLAGISVPQPFASRVGSPVPELVSSNRPAVGTGPLPNQNASFGAFAFHTQSAQSTQNV